MLGEEGCAGAGLSQGRCPLASGCQGPPSPAASGCRPAALGSTMPPAPLGGLGKHFLLRSHLQFFSWYLSFMTF